MSDREGWHQIITAFPVAETTIAYRSESGHWWFPDAAFNEASPVGAVVTPLYTQAEVDELIERAGRKSHDSESRQETKTARDQSGNSRTCSPDTRASVDTLTPEDAVGSVVPVGEVVTRQRLGLADVECVADDRVRGEQGCGDGEKGAHEDHGREPRADGSRECGGSPRLSLSGLRFDGEPHVSETSILDLMSRTPVDPELLERVRNHDGSPLSLGHHFIGVAGHPDDDECTYRSDGTDATYCGATEHDHESHDLPTTGEGQ